jgi:hypothetical protein
MFLSLLEVEGRSVQPLDACCTCKRWDRDGGEFGTNGLLI